MLIAIFMAAIFFFIWALSICGANGENAEHCVMCGEVIPEGRQVCPNCEREVKENA